jgi:hypothetical protein
MRWRGAGDVAASQGLADGQAIAAKHRQGDAARHLASERSWVRSWVEVGPRIKIVVSAGVCDWFIRNGILGCCVLPRLRDH